MTTLLTNHLSSVRATFRPGDPWPATDGQQIRAGGGGFLREGSAWYWVGEQRQGSASEGISLYRSHDLYKWTRLGILLEPSATAGHPLERGGIMERPKILRNPHTGDYVLWFHVEVKGQGYGAAMAGVARSERIEGPWEFVRAFRPNGNASRDMTVYETSPGEAWLIYASEGNFTLRAARLADDYLEVTALDEPLFRRHREAPALFQHDGRLYMFTSGCTGWGPNPAELHVADSILGPWRHLGDPCRGEESETTFRSQSTFVIPVPDRGNAFIFAADRWRPGELHNSAQVWLPVEFGDGGRPFLRMHEEWDLDRFALF